MPQLNISMYNVKDIDTKGYAVIKNFLSMEEAETYHAQFDIIDKEQYKFNDIYKIIMSRNNIQSVKDKLQTLTECINQQTGSTTNLVDKNVEFASSKLLNFSWHQEHEAYHMLQSFKDFFRLWVPIYKTESSKSGMIMIPNDKFEEILPELWRNRLYYKGATRFFSEGDKTRFIDDITDEEVLLDIDLHAIGEIPEVGVGDLIIFRGDVVHMTQDNNTLRVSAVFKYFNKDTVINKDVFYDMSVGADDVTFEKGKFIKSNKFYQNYFELFETRDSFTLGEVLEHSRMKQSKV